MLVLPPTALPAGSTCAVDRTWPAPVSAGRRRSPPIESRIVGADLANLSALPITLLAGAIPVDGTAEVDVSEGYLQHLGLPDSRAAELRRHGRGARLRTPDRSFRINIC